MPGHENRNGNLDILSQQGTIRGSRHSIVGYVSENGFLYDSHHTLLGYVTQQGVVRDLTLTMVGQVNIQKHSFPAVHQSGRRLKRQRKGHEYKPVMFSQNMEETQHLCLFLRH